MLQINIKIFFQITGYIFNMIFALDCFFFFFGCPTWHVELSWPGIEPVPPAVEAQSLNH